VKYGRGPNLAAILAASGATEEPTPSEYESMTVADLRAAAEAAGLATSGTKAELIERLTGGDA